ncbi:MAG: RidA family protein [Rhodocyclaceae bacterium]|nr:MAG: RidA family protein [Rhodocyclaceae bacterium]
MTPEEAKGQRESRPGPGGVESGASRARTTPPPAAPAKKAEVAPAAVAQAPAAATAAVRPTETPAASREVAVASSGYPQASRYGDLLFISGQIPIDLRTMAVNVDATIEEQTRVALENLRTVLEANRLTMANVVSTTVYLKNINDLGALDSVYLRYFKNALPARSVVEVTRLPRGALIEISAIAGR